MSHNTHVFLSNEDTAYDAMSFVNSALDDNTMAYNGVDSFDILGALNLTTGEYTNNKYRILSSYEDEIQTIKELEEYANSLFSIERYEYLIQELYKNIKDKNWFTVSSLAKYLDGIKYAVRDGRKWTAKDPFCINDGYLDMSGITDYIQARNPIKDRDLFAVIVDFHS